MDVGRSIHSQICIRSSTSLPMSPSLSSISSYNKLLRSVASTLLTEAGHSFQHLHHVSSSEMRSIVHNLLVVRPPPDDGIDEEEEEELCRQIDKLLELELN
ncbi:unnamed protein product [Phytophthora lilii]|uniref:Unnamed protein product n=1 Tax=Phytophthora lilii TaxID=2077276 RepID=A0A9W6T893_9STRA|nr:unnamed protein product [Phytophthora lilii]